jgi:single-strand DNA-binding protein
MLIGRVGKDPETKYTASGTTVTTFSMATSESWKDKAGNKQERTTWHNIESWNKLAEIVGEYVKKGSLVYVEGRIGQQEWEKNGTKHYKTIITANTVNMLGSKQGNGQQDGGQSSTDHGPADDDFIPEEDDVPL